jgi:hypothetical protein
VIPALPPLHFAALRLCSWVRPSDAKHRIDVVFGDPFEAGDGSGRRTKAALDAATTRIQERLTAHLEYAKRATGRLCRT